MPTTNDRLILEMLCCTGLRWSELTGLHRARVDLGRGMLRVIETYDQAGDAVGGVIKPYPKSRKAREVPLTPSLVEQLAALPPAAALTCGVVHTAGGCPGPLMLTAHDDRPLRNSNWASRVWEPALERAGIGHVRPHDCRHTYASWLLQRGISLAEVGRLLGHSSTPTTERYAHLAETPSAAVLAALADC